jgi:hypothetical protein
MKKWHAFFEVRLLQIQRLTLTRISHKPAADAAQALMPNAT